MVNQRKVLGMTRMVTFYRMFKTEYSFMEQDTLYIIGNGFDIAHGLSTQYQNFKEWLLKNGLNSFARRMEILYPDVKNDNGDWNDIETALGHFNMEDVIAYDKYYTDCNYSKEVVLPVGNNIKAVTASLSGNLWKWIKSVDLLTAKRMFQLEETALFVNFNYTLTLENVYEIPDAHVWHIHGSISDKTNVLVVGYGVDDMFDNAPNPPSYNPTDDDMRRNIMTDMKKPVDYCIDEFHKWHCSAKLKNIKHVKVIGHSCSNVDEPYFADIAKSISKDADWVFYIHNGRKEKKYAEFASRIISQDGLEQVYSVVLDANFPLVK